MMNRLAASKRRLWSLLAVFSVLVLIFVYLNTPNQEVYPRTSKWKGVANSRRLEEDGGQSSVNLDAQILNQPKWVQDKSWGLSAAPNGVTLQKGQFTPEILKGSSGDQEVEIAWTNFFHGTTNGLVLELGAMDGKFFSASDFFEKEAGWKAILVEASSQALEIPTNRPNALSLQLAVCQHPSTIHFLNAEDVGGILEFMTPEYVRQLHPGLLKAVSSDTKGQSVMDIVDWDKVEATDYVVKLPCAPLQAVLDRFHFDHINFLILDLEGGELAALRSLDFSRIHFDVMCIETNRFKNESDPYIDQVVKFVTGKGYKLYERTKGRNSWFVSPSYKKV